ncbi:hypothetical protein GGI35DRAFT_436577 [Trichoderma velutinum]
MSQQPADMATSQNIQSCPLLQVPAEILDRITWHLTTPELCNLRITCKSVEEALYYSFTAEFFTRKQFMVSEFSLGALKDISKSRFAGHLRHVHFGLNQIKPSDTSAISSGVQTEDQRGLFQLRLVEQDTLWSLGLVSKYMAEAFARLPNLESVVVRDFNSRRRSRDGPHAHWLSYGTQTMMKEIAVRPTSHGAFSLNSTHFDYVDHLFRAVIHALAMAKASPKAIEVMERQGNPLTDFAFHIHPDFEADIAPVLRSLKRLHLSLEANPNSSLGLDKPYHRLNLTKFLRHCDGLEELRINGRHNHYNNFNDRNNLNSLYDWLTAAESTSETEAQKETISPSLDGPTSDFLLLNAPTKFPRLENISLGMTSFAVDDLVRFIAKFADTVQFLELWRIRLVSDDRSLEKDQVIGTRGALFKELLNKLLNIPGLNLRHIKLGMLQQSWHSPSTGKLINDVTFKPTAKTPDEDVDTGVEMQRMTNVLEYTGTDWRHFVKHEMIPRLYTTEIRDPADIRQELEYDDDDDDEVDEDEDNDDNMDQNE